MFLFFYCNKWKRTPNSLVSSFIRQYPREYLRGFGDGINLISKIFVTLPAFFLLVNQCNICIFLFHIKVLRMKLIMQTAFSFWDAMSNIEKNILYIYIL